MGCGAGGVAPASASAASDARSLDRRVAPSDAERWRCSVGAAATATAATASSDAGGGGSSSAGGATSAAPAPSTGSAGAPPLEPSSTSECAEPRSLQLVKKKINQLWEIDLELI